MILGEEVKNQFVRKTKYDDNMNKAYALILGQCAEGLKNILQTRKYWEKDVKNQPIGILKAIK